jgi:hypothetical protein
MVTENGPFVFETNRTNFKLNEYSWNKKANVIYLESPGGVIIKSFRLDSAKVLEIIPMMMEQLPRTTIEPLLTSLGNSLILRKMTSS